MTRDGRGWREQADGSGKAPKHKKAAERSGARSAMNTPMRKEKKLRVGTKVRISSDWDKIRFHKDAGVGTVVGKWFNDLSVSFPLTQAMVAQGMTSYDVVVPAKDLIIVSHPKKGYKHADAPTMEKVENFTEKLHGSGIDYNWHIDETKSAIKATNAYHSMNDVGMYDAIINFTVSFPRNEPMGNFKLTFRSGSHRQAEKHMLREYLDDTIASVLDELGYR